MKKPIILFSVILCLSIFVTSCQKASDSNSSSTASSNLISSAVSSTVSAAVSSSASSTVASSSTSSSAVTDPIIKKFADDMQSQISSLQAQFGDTMKVSISARGNSFVYSFQYKIDVGATSVVKTSLEGALSSSASVYEGIVQQLKTLGAKSPSVIIEYLDKDGKMIVSKEFK